MTKNNLRIISKAHAYLQTMTKTSVKFQMNQHETVGVAHTRYIVLGGWKDGRKDGRNRLEGQRAENHVPPLFFEKAGDNNRNYLMSLESPQHIA